MDIVYYLDEKIHENRRTGAYVPVTMNIIRENSKDFPQKYIHPNHYLYSFHILEDRIKQGLPVYIVIFIHHSGRDEATKYFFTENEARKYINFLALAIRKKQKIEDVDVHYENGSQNLYKLLKDMPLNTYTSFQTPGDTFSITLAKSN